MKKTYNTQQFAELIGLSKSRVLALSHSGVIKPNRTITGRPFYTDEHVNLYFGFIDAREGK